MAKLKISPELQKLLVTTTSTDLWCNKYLKMYAEQESKRIDSEMLKIKMETQSTLDEDYIYDGRQVGNSTRLVDLAIQIIFTGKRCQVIDHHGSREANENLAKRIMQRIQVEHPRHAKDITIDNVSGPTGG
jgi:hypothetical protein